MKPLKEAIRAVCPSVHKYMIVDLVITQGQAIKLLKAERARVRRVVKKMIREIDTCSDPEHPTNMGYRLALMDLLTALKGRP